MWPPDQTDFIYVGATVITHLFGLGMMAPESHPIMLLERIRNCRYYWQLNCFELLRLYLTCTHTPLDSAPSKPLRPLIHLIICHFRRNPPSHVVYTFLHLQPQLRGPYDHRISLCRTHLVLR